MTDWSMLLIPRNCKHLGGREKEEGRKREEGLVSVSFHTYLEVLLLLLLSLVDKSRMVV